MTITIAFFEELTVEDPWPFNLIILVSNDIAISHFQCILSII